MSTLNALGLLNVLLGFHADDSFSFLVSFGVLSPVERKRISSSRGTKRSLLAVSIQLNKSEVG